MPINRLIYGTWGLILLGAMGIAGYNLKPRLMEQSESFIGEPAPSLGGGLNEIEQTEFIQEVPGRLPIVTNDPLADSKMQALSKIVTEEMPNASAEEIDIWTDEFKDLPEEAIRFMLRQKRQTEGNPIAIGQPDSMEMPQLAPSPKPESATGFEAARRIAVSNLLNASTCGYREQILEFRGVADDEPHVSRVELAEVRSSLAEGKRDYTGRKLDVALSIGFFAVSRDEETYFTRCGRFSLNADKHLVLTMGDTEYTVDGVQQVPSETTTIDISPSGEVRASLQDGTKADIGQLRVADFLDASRLKSIGGCLFQPSKASGQPNYAKGLHVQQHWLEGSNVDPELVRSMLRQLSEWQSLASGE